MEKMGSILLSVLLVTVMVLCQAKQEEVTQVNDAGEGSQCDKDERVAQICLACSSLPLNAEVTLTTCCSMETAFLFCNACVNDPESSGNVLDELDELKSLTETLEDYYDTGESDDNGEYSYDYSNDDLIDSKQKRFGTLFLKSPKRYGRLFGKRSPEKRYGRLYMGSGSYFGKRSLDGLPEYDDMNDIGDVDKRFGYVLGSSYKLGKRGASMPDLPDKRYGQVLFGQNKWYGKRDSADDVFDGSDIDKRYGRLFVGNKGWFGKRSDEEFENDMDKRYGRLLVGNKGWFGKRSDEQFENDMDKRYGRLFVSNKGWFGKRSDDEFENDMDKRYGRLFVGNKGWFGKRSESEGDNIVDKRYGRLFFGNKGWFGKRSDGDIEKRFGRLFMGRRRGSWFG